MRVLGVLVALVATPVLVGVSQDRGQAATKPSAAGACATADAKRSPTAVPNSPQPLDPKARERLGCSPTAPAAPPPPQPPPPVEGTVAITGQVFYDMDGRPGLPSWVVEVTGPVNATTLTDAGGNYAFTGLPVGTYQVCEQVPVSWVQTYPTSGASCAGGFGYTFTLKAGETGSHVLFGNSIRLF